MIWKFDCIGSIEGIFTIGRCIGFILVKIVFEYFYLVKKVANMSFGVKSVFLIVMKFWRLKLIMIWMSHLAIYLQ
jgi:hypothetical protein